MPWKEEKQRQLRSSHKKFFLLEDFHSSLATGSSEPTGYPLETKQQSSKWTQEDPSSPNFCCSFMTLIHTKMTRHLQGFYITCFQNILFSFQSNIQQIKKVACRTSVKARCMLQEPTNQPAKIASAGGDRWRFCWRFFFTAVHKKSTKPLNF